MKQEQDFLGNAILKEDMRSIETGVKESGRLKGCSVFITGATGMIASYFTMFLIYLNENYQYGIQIYAGVRSEEKARWRFGKYLDRDYFHLVRGNILDPVAIDTPLHYIVHAASLASPQYYGKMPVETMLPNVIGTYRLLERAGTEPLRGFLFFSSGSVYGSVEGELSIGETSVGKLDWLASGNVYGESKRCAEAMCLAYYREHGLPVKIARIHHTYGPTMDVENDKRVFSEFVGDILSGRNIVLKSDGQGKRAFCYLSDTVSGLFRILLDGENGGLYNVGNADAYIRMRDLAELLVGLFPEKNLTVEYREREDAGYCASPVSRLIPLNTEKLEQLGWRARVDIRDGFKRSICYLAGQ